MAALGGVLRPASRAGFVTKTDRNGRFVLPAVVGPMTKVFTLPGFRTFTCAVPSVTGQQSWAVHLAPPPRTHESCERER
jgi:hypothetical protein